MPPSPAKCNKFLLCSHLSPPSFFEGDFVIKLASRKGSSPSLTFLPRAHLLFKKRGEEEEETALNKCKEVRERKEEAIGRLFSVILQFSLFSF